MRRSLVLILAGASVAACAPATATAPGAQAGAARTDARPCFQPARITNFTQTDTQGVYVKVMGGGVFELSSAGCPDLGRGLSLVIVPSIGSGDRLCVGDSARVAAPDGSFGPQRCLARVERALTAAEVEALPSRQRP